MHVALDRTTDKFQLGQWLHGRIYEPRSDLSPDGKHLIYFAINGHWEGEARGSWTAISRDPYLKAITLLAKGDCSERRRFVHGRLAMGSDDGTGTRQSGIARCAARSNSPRLHYGKNDSACSTFGSSGMGGELNVRELGRWQDRSVFERLPGGW